LKRAFKKFWWILPLILILILAGFVIWAETPARPMPEALAAMQSDTKVTVESGGWISFTPQSSTPTQGLIFYPGGRVDPRAYAPLARGLAEKGYLTVIAPMPLNLAVFSPARAAEIIAAYPEITTWAIAGHSLGGAMAANFTAKNPELVQGLGLLAAYPASSDNLSSLDLAVVSIFGTQDGLATAEKIDASRALLPSDTQWIAINGGNHAQFGWYGPQGGDNPATISRAEQQQQIITALANLFEQVKER
jgi:hypothetical protein